MSPRRQLELRWALHTAAISFLVFTTFVIPIMASSPIQLQQGQTACGSAGWSDVLIFSVVNYLAHAVTVVKFPGETDLEINGRRIDSLLAPYIGLMYALRKIQWFLLLERDALKRANHGEALCQIIRSGSWRPTKGIVVGAKSRQANAEDRSDIAAKYCNITIEMTKQSGPKPVLVGPRKLALVLGYVTLPHGYCIQRCQGIPGLSVHPKRGALHPQYSYFITENVIALTQILFSTISLYQARGSQLDRFGVGAFALSVIPFAAMSTANLVANIVSTDYSLLHLVESEEMEEAVHRGAVVAVVAGKLIKDPAVAQSMRAVRFDEINGVLYAFELSGAKAVCLGEVVDESPSKSQAQCPADIEIIIPSHAVVQEDKPKTPNARFWDNFGMFLAVPIGLILFMAPSVVIWAMTRYRAQQSTVLERTGLLLWLYLQQGCLLFLLLWNQIFGVEHALRAPKRYSWVLRVSMSLPLRVVGILGYVIVVKELVSFGVCIRFG